MVNSEELIGTKEHRTL